MLLKGLRPQQTCADICAPVCLSTNGATRVPVFFSQVHQRQPPVPKIGVNHANLLPGLLEMEVLFGTVPTYATGNEE